MSKKNVYIIIGTMSKEKKRTQLLQLSELV